MKVAKERKSSVLASNAVHHRVDSLTSIVALFTIGGSYVFQDATWLDPVGGLLISLMVIKAGWGNTMTSLLELADTTVDDDIKNSVQTAAAKALKALEDGEEVIVRDVQGMKSGQNYLMDIELAVPGEWAITRSRVVEEAVRKTVGEKVRGVKRVKIRFIPAEQTELTFSEEFVSQDTGANPEPESNGNNHNRNHDHDHDHEHSHEDSISRKKQ
jgi:divalent metal cation (Fe/Co/Zn/Cd) transporter